MSDWYLTIKGAVTPMPIEKAATDPVFVIRHHGKTYVTILTQEISLLSQEAQNYYLDKFAEGVEIPVDEARQVNIREADNCHPTIIRP